MGRSTVETAIAISAMNCAVVIVLRTVRANGTIVIVIGSVRNGGMVETVVMDVIIRDV